MLTVDNSVVLMGAMLADLLERWGLMLAVMLVRKRVELTVVSTVVMKADL